MRYVLALFLLGSAILIPLACGNSNNIPTTIGNAATKTFTPTPTGTVTPLTSTPTGTPTTSGFTPTVTITPATYDNTYGTAASPNGMVISYAAGGPTTIMTLAEVERGSHGGVEGIEEFNVGSGGTTTGVVPGGTYYLYAGAPTPASTPAWVPVTYTLTGPQGFINPGYTGGYAAVLDTQSGGGATLYCGNSSNMGSAASPPGGWQAGYFGSGEVFYEPLYTNGYGSIAFNNPKSLTGDANGYMYVADTGNGLVEEFYGYSGYNTVTNNEIQQLHYTAGNGGITFINPTGPVTFVSKNFISPYACTIDANTLDGTPPTAGNLWVTDTGYSPSVVQEFSFSGGVSIYHAWQTIPGCKATGIAIAPPTSTVFAGFVYIADSGNNQIEIYDRFGTIQGILSDPHSVYEGGKAFSPSCIGFNEETGDLWVADTANDNIISFTPH